MKTATDGWFDSSEMFIGGRWRAAQATLPLENPSDGTEIGLIARGGEAEIGEAVSAARLASEGPWGRATAVERGRAKLSIRAAPPGEKSQDLPAKPV